ncbi:MAG TPA: HNH endonuclease [Pyrinomonadaceae bacterium]|nr:HNH endonuclease [Pyrinomonadaceae bacterium]
MAKRIPKFHSTQIARFWKRVDSSRGPDDCWLWSGHIGENGYGIISINGRGYKAHRVSFFLEHGRISNDRLILHRCDVRACVNPSHLFQGTPKDNSQDAVRKGRNTRLYGERNGKAKLSRESVLAIRRMCRRPNVYQKDVARHFGVSEATVSYVVNGGRWKKVVSPPSPRRSTPGSGRA